MIFTQSWPPKWKKIRSGKKYFKFGNIRKGCISKYFKIKKRYPAHRGSNVITFTPS